ncbi:hypothetical protein PIB30_039115 [Stylosanthes scabra]|uniref:Uncharacterized protein n=1 Tax=Stylosanthes scabra TaxID=79078 RepID=A0ABU6REB3_9FABA|nr:hypothetical protein [Stylosanthes scabra]
MQLWRKGQVAGTAGFALAPCGIDSGLSLAVVVCGLIILKDLATRWRLRIKSWRLYRAAFVKKSIKDCFEGLNWFYISVNYSFVLLLTGFFELKINLFKHEVLLHYQVEKWTYSPVSEKGDLAPILLVNISKVPLQHQQIILRIIVKVIGECHSSQIGDEVAAKYKKVKR